MKMLISLSIFSIFVFALSDAQLDPLCSSVLPGELYLFPYPGDCTKYTECVSGVRTAEDCPDGLWFNSRLQACDHPDTSGCVSFVCPPGIVDYFPGPVCSQYIECYRGISETHSCPEGLWFNAREKRCVSAQVSACGQFSTSVESTWMTPTDLCYGVLPGYIVLKPFPGDCSRYIRCVGAEASSEACPPSLFFNSEKQMCLQPNFSDCDDGTRTPDPYSTTTVNPPTTPHGNDDPRCADGNNNYWPDQDCTKYIECYQGQGYLRECPGGLYFNPQDLMCEDRTQSSCMHSHPIVDPDSTTKEGDWTASPNCLNYDRYPFPGDCTRYLVCYGGELAMEDCPPDLWFNPYLLVCDYPYQNEIKSKTCFINSTIHFFNVGSTEIKMPYFIVRKS